MAYKNATPSIEVTLEDNIPLPEKYHITPLFDLPFLEMELGQSFAINLMDFFEAYEKRHGYKHKLQAETDLTGNRINAKDRLDLLKRYVTDQKQKIRTKNLYRWDSRGFAYEFIMEQNALRCWRVK